MYLDAQTLLSDSQAFSATAFSTNTYDSGAATDDISVGSVIGIGMTVDTAADFTTGDETYIMEVVQSANANLSSPDVLNSMAILASALTLGAKHFLAIPPKRKTKRYLGLRLTLAGTTPSVTVTAWILPANMWQAEAVYPDNITIS